MSALQRQFSELRDARPALARQRISAACAKMLEQSSLDNGSMAAIAERANVLCAGYR